MVGKTFKLEIAFWVLLPRKNHILQARSHMTQNATSLKIYRQAEAHIHNKAEPSIMEAILQVVKVLTRPPGFEKCIDISYLCVLPHVVLPGLTHWNNLYPATLNLTINFILCQLLDPVPISSCAEYWIMFG